MSRMHNEFTLLRRTTNNDFLPASLPEPISSSLPIIPSSFLSNEPPNGNGNNIYRTYSTYPELKEEKNRENEEVEIMEEVKKDEVKIEKEVSEVRDVRDVKDVKYDEIQLQLHELFEHARKTDERVEKLAKLFLSISI